MSTLVEFEKLAIEVGAAKAGLRSVLPRTVQGESGVVHSFNLLLSDGHRLYAFDIYDSVTPREVVKSYAKELDTGCTVSLVCPAGGTAEEAGALATSYGLRVITPDAAGKFFSLEKAAPRGASN